MMRIAETVDRMIHHAHERGLVINEIKMDTSTYDDFVEDTYARCHIKDTDRGKEYLGYLLRRCVGCGELTIKIIPKR